jgi:hypothetical protein
MCVFPYDKLIFQFSDDIRYAMNMTLQLTRTVRHFRRHRGHQFHQLPAEVLPYPLHQHQVLHSRRRRLALQRIKLFHQTVEMAKVCKLHD